MKTFLVGFAFLIVLSSQAFALSWSSAPPPTVSAGQSYGLGAHHTPGSETVFVYIFKNGTLVGSDSGNGGAGASYGSPGDSGGQTITYLAEGHSYNPGSGWDSSLIGYTTVIATNAPPDQHLDVASYNSGTISASGWAADPNTGAPVNRVEIFMDDVYKGDANLGGDRQDVANVYGRSDYRFSGYSYSFSSGGVSPGNHTVKARAFDSVGAYSERTYSFNVTNNHPTVSLTINGVTSVGGGTNATTIYNGTGITISTTAGDQDGNLQRIRVWTNYNGQGWLQRRDVGASSDSFSYTLNGIGTHEVHCRSMDTQGVESSTAIINVNSANRPPDLPTIANGGVTSAAMGSSVSLTATLRDLDGNLAYHSLSYLPPGGSWTLVPNAPTAPSNLTNSTVSGSFAPTSVGAWQFKTSGHDGSLWGPEAILSVEIYDGTAPTIPAGLSVSAVTGGSFILSWNASGDNVGVTAYEVLRDGASLGTTASLSLGISGLAEATAYNMQVRARDAAGNWSAPSPALQVATADVTVPSIPIGLSSTGNTTGTSFTLNWSASSDNVGVTAYEVMRDATSLGTIGTTSMGVSGGLTQGATYNMKVRARDAAGNWSNWSTPMGITIADVEVPSTPISLAASGNTNGTSFTLGWSASSDNVAVIAYEVMRDTTSLGTTAGTSMIVSGLSSGATYAIKIRARDAAANWSAWSTVLSVTTPDVTGPSKPNGLSASANTTGNSFTLSWLASNDNLGVTAYEVFRNGVSQGTTATLSMDQTGLSLSASYSMTVRARDAAANWSVVSDSLVVITPDPNGPTIPTGLTAASLTGTGFTLSWTASTDNVGVTAYQVRRDTTTLTPNSTISPRAISGLTPGLTYSFTVRAGDAAGNWSGWSAALQVTIPDTTAPGAPTGLAASSITPVGFTLSWTASTDNGQVVAYEIRRGTTVLTSSATGTTYGITGLWPGTSYSMTIRAKDAVGNWSSWSSALNVTTTADSDPSNQTQLKIHRPN